MSFFGYTAKSLAPLPRVAVASFGGALDEYLSLFVNLIEVGIK